MEQSLPSDVRPPTILVQTLDHLINEVVGNDNLEDSHPFVRDRTRAIRQDFTLQSTIGEAESVMCHERIARYHILCAHSLCASKGFSAQQEQEQLRKTLKSLVVFYRDIRRRGAYLGSEHEPEFQAYYLISHMTSIEFGNHLQSLPLHIIQSSHVQLAIKFHALSTQNNDPRRHQTPCGEAAQNLARQFFKAIRRSNVSYLMACSLEVHFPDVRKAGFKAMNKAYLDRAGLAGFDISEIVYWFGFDDDADALDFCQHYGIKIQRSSGSGDIANGFAPERLEIRFGRDLNSKKLYFNDEALKLPQKTSLIVEAKRQNIPYFEIINGTSLNLTVNVTEMSPRSNISAMSVISPAPPSARMLSRTPSAIFSEVESERRLKTARPSVSSIPSWAISATTAPMPRTPTPVRLTVPTITTPTAATSTPTATVPSFIPGNIFQIPISEPAICAAPSGSPSEEKAELIAERSAMREQVAKPVIHCREVLETLERQVIDELLESICREALQEARIGYLQQAVARSVAELLIEQVTSKMLHKLVTIPRLREKMEALRRRQAANLLVSGVIASLKRQKEKRELMSKITRINVQSISMQRPRLSARSNVQDIFGSKQRNLAVGPTSKRASLQQQSRGADDIYAGVYHPLDISRAFSAAGLAGKPLNGCLESKSQKRISRGKATRLLERHRHFWQLSKPSKYLASRKTKKYCRDQSISRCTERKSSWIQCPDIAARAEH